MLVFLGRPGKKGERSRLLVPKGLHVSEPDALKDRKSAPTGRRDGTAQQPWLAFYADGERIRLCSAPAADGIRQLHLKRSLSMRETHCGAPSQRRTGGHPLSMLRTSGSSSPDTGIPNLLIWELFRKAPHSYAAAANICQRRGFLRASFWIPLGYAGGLASWMAHLCLTTRGSFGIERASPSSADLSTGHLTTITLSSSSTTAISTTIITGWWRVSCRSMFWSTPFHRTKTFASRCQSRWT